MPFELAESDKFITESVRVIFPREPKLAGGEGDIGDFLDIPFPFQFPPRVTTDSKTANWDEHDKITYEPIAIYRGSQARKLTIEAEYILTGSNVGTGSSSPINRWGGEEIARLVQAAKSYFYRSVQSVLGGGADGEGAFGPAIKILNLYGAVRQVTDEVGSTWRLSSVDATYSDTLVIDNQSYWPLKTKLVISCMSYTQLADEGASDFKLAKLGNLASKPTPQWY